MKIRIALAVASSAFATFATVDYLKTRKIEQAKREKIQIDTKLEIQAIRTAANIVVEKILAGEYDGKLDNIMTDYEFYKITSR